jgi:acetoin utilization protein AcuB
MSKDVHTVSPEDCLVDAYELMKIHRIRHIPVVESGRLVGIVSDRDVRHAMPARPPEKDLSEFTYGKTLCRTPISMAMTPDPRTIDPEAPIREAAEVICCDKIGALPVVADGKLVGIISAEDLLLALVENTRGAPA